MLNVDEVEVENDYKVISLDLDDNITHSNAIIINGNKLFIKLDINTDKVLAIEQTDMELFQAAMRSIQKR